MLDLSLQTPPLNVSKHQEFHDVDSVVDDESIIALVEADFQDGLLQSLESLAQSVIFRWVERCFSEDRSFAMDLVVEKFEQTSFLHVVLTDLCVCVYIYMCL